MTKWTKKCLWVNPTNPLSIATTNNSRHPKPILTNYPFCHIKLQGYINKITMEMKIMLPHKIPHFLLSPCLDHFPWVVLAISVSKSIITLYITISIPEVVNEEKIMNIYL